ncbi:Uncharacterised protein [Mycobacteroides abscessus subsp. abscessus]|nr:Uncharacterised protein [Mycobacteroides abscessus]SHU65288.1 Uncharacterised protein [Mycobacteroides abscessus subsp. abscessus]
MTDRPNEAPNESATVPTMTSEATKLRVINSMIRKIKHNAEMPAIIRSYLAPSDMSLKTAAVPPNSILASSSGVPFTASIAACLIGST